MQPEIQQDLAQDRDNLQQIIIKCSERCLYQSAKWAAELLSSAADADRMEDDEEELDEQSLHIEAERVRRARLTAVSSLSLNPKEAVLEARELPQYLLAKSFFECREFDRCAAVFLPDLIGRGPPDVLPAVNAPRYANVSPRKGKDRPVDLRSPRKQPRNSVHIKPRRKRLSQKALFLVLYAKYMSGEKRKDEELEQIIGPHDTGAIPNPELRQLEHELSEWLLKRNINDSEGWLEYLYGIVLIKLKNEEEAKKLLLTSIRLQPYNWGAWQELSSLMHNNEGLIQVMHTLPAVNTMCLCFYIHTSQELFQSTADIHSRLSYMLLRYPTSSWLLSQRALLHYHAKDYASAEPLFTSILHTDPHRLDGLDHYSNLLYVLSDRPKLAFLAQLATATDKFRPETCCIVGNYYSLTSQHEKAIAYFRRALTLDRTCLSAWTLMGHEYVELKNTHAAIDSYRRAVDLNRKDYRAWYGLGQTYELLEMHYYSLWYYQRAASLRPWDSTLWAAVGNCWGRMERWSEAIRALKRAMLCGALGNRINPSGAPELGEEDGGEAEFDALTAEKLDPELLSQVAALYEKAGDSDSAKDYMEQVIAQEDDQFDMDEDTESLAVPLDIAAGGSRKSSILPLMATRRTTGTGVTATTSRARMWLAKFEMSHGNYARAAELATELCQDGWELEESKAMVRDCRARIEEAAAMEKLAAQNRSSLARGRSSSSFSDGVDSVR